MLMGDFLGNVEILYPPPGCLEERPVVMELQLSPDLSEALGEDLHLWVLDRPVARDVFYPMGCHAIGSSVRLISPERARIANYIGREEPDMQWWELLVVVADQKADEKFRRWNAQPCGGESGPSSMRRDQLPLSAQVKDSVWVRW